MNDNLTIAFRPQPDLGDSEQYGTTYPPTRRQERKVRFGTSFLLTVEARTQVFLRLRPASLVSVRDDLVVTRLTVPSSEGRVLSTPDVDLVAAGARSSQLLDRTTLEAGSTQISYTAETTVDELYDAMPAAAAAPRFDRLTPEDWWWLQPSRYCRPDEFGDEAWAMFGSSVSNDAPATGATVRAICSYVNDNMQFGYGTTTSFTSATESWLAKRGVCRDFNHIAVSFCRALNIPTRYAFGYMPDIDITPSSAPMDFCAWFEVFLDGRWWTFDARVNEPRIGRIVVGRGRDAADVPMISTLGAAILTEFSVHAYEDIGPAYRVAAQV